MVELRGAAQGVAADGGDEVSVMDERAARIQDSIEQCDRVKRVLLKIKQGREPVSDVDGRVVRRLIRLLVEEWV